MSPGRSGYKLLVVITFCRDQTADNSPKFFNKNKTGRKCAHEEGKQNQTNTEQKYKSKRSQRGKNAAKQKKHSPGGNRGQVVGDGTKLKLGE